MIRPALIGAVVLCALTPATLAAVESTTAYAANPTRNSIDWSAAVAAQGGSITTAIELLGRDGEMLDRLADLCERGVVAQGGENHLIRSKPGAEAGSMLEPLSAGEGEMDVAQAIVFQDSGAWTLVISFRLPVLGAGVMSADLFNPTGDNPLVLRAFNGPDGSGDLLAEATSPAFNFQLNRLCFLGVVDPASRIRSITVSTPGLYPDEVFLTDVLMAVDAGWNDSAAPDADVNLDGVVDEVDLALVSGAFGSSCRGLDIDGDGDVDTDDRLAVVNSLGDSTIPVRTHPGPVVGGEVLPPTTGGGSPNGSPRGSGSTHSTGGSPAPNSGEPSIPPIGSSSSATSPVPSTPGDVAPSLSDESSERSSSDGAETAPVTVGLDDGTETRVPAAKPLNTQSAETPAAAGGASSAPVASNQSAGPAAAESSATAASGSRWLSRGLRLLLGT